MCGLHLQRAPADCRRYLEDIPEVSDDADGE